MSELILRTLVSTAAFWHTLAFAAGSVHVVFAYRTLFQGEYDSRWTRVLRSADRHLWASGFAIIGLGIALSGFAYLANPKLWAKSALILFWVFSTQAMNRYAMPRLRRGERTPMLLTSSVSIACWAYGAFLGVANPLANGVAPFWALAAGFFATIFGFMLVTFVRERKHFLSSCSETKEAEHVT